MFRFTIRDGLWLTALVVLGAGCHSNTRINSKTRIILQGADRVDKHAKEIEQAAEVPAPRPADSN